MVKQHFVSLAAIFLLIPTGSFGASANRLNQSIEAEEYAVYSAVINELYTRHRKQLVIAKDYMAQDSSHDRNYQAALQNHQDLSADVRANYETKNKSPYSLENRLNLIIPYVLLPTKECQKLKRKKETEKFKAKCLNRGEVMVLSRVGFDAEKNQALVRVEIRCGGLLCGEGVIVVLEKVKADWKISRYLLAWES
jgi:hypothetical protein